MNCLSGTFSNPVVVRFLANARFERSLALDRQIVIKPHVTSGLLAAITNTSEALVAGLMNFFGALPFANRFASYRAHRSQPDLLATAFVLTDSCSGDDLDNYVFQSTNSIERNGKPGTKRRLRTKFILDALSNVLNRPSLHDGEA